MTHYAHPSPYNISEHHVNVIEKKAKHLVAMISNNNDNNSWSNFSAATYMIARHVIESTLEETAYLVFKFLQNIELAIKNKKLNSPIAEFQQLDKSGMITKEAKDLVIKTILQEQQSRIPLEDIASIQFTQMLIDVSNEYDVDKILTFEWN
jgi:hypothetical protein